MRIDVLGATGPQGPQGASGSVTDYSVSLRSSDVVSVPNNTFTAITWGIEDYDTDTMHSTVSNTSRVTFTHAGKYMAVVSADMFPSSACGVTYRVSKNGVGGALKQVTHYISTADIAISGTVNHQVAVVVNASAGDYIELFVLVQHDVGTAAEDCTGSLFQVYRVA